MSDKLRYSRRNNFKKIKDTLNFIKNLKGSEHIVMALESFIICGEENQGELKYEAVKYAGNMILNKYEDTQEERWRLALNFL